MPEGTRGLASVGPCARRVFSALLSPAAAVCPRIAGVRVCGMVLDGGCALYCACALQEKAR